MSVLVQQPAPDFKADAVLPDGSFTQVSMGEYKGKKHVLLFFYPFDFTFVCPTEIIAFSDRASDFEKLGVQILGCSIDSKFVHLAWRNTARTQGGLGQINYPLVADVNKEIARSYGVLLPGGMAFRGLFLIDTNGIVRHQVVNDLPLGRSVDEALRMVKASSSTSTTAKCAPPIGKKARGPLSRPLATAKPSSRPNMPARAELSRRLHPFHPWTAFMG